MPSPVARAWIIICVVILAATLTFSLGVLYGERASMLRLCIENVERMDAGGYSIVASLDQDAHLYYWEADQ